MKKNTILPFLGLFFCLFIGSQNLNATHIAVVELFYKYVGDCSEGPNDPRPYEVYAKVYYDCNGIGAQPTVDVNVSSTLYPNPIPLTLDSFTVVDPVTGCPLNTGSPPNICLDIPIDSTLPCPKVVGCVDVEEVWYRYQDANGNPEVILLPPAFDWRFSYESCCRPSAATNIPGDQGIYVDAFLNNLYDSVVMLAGEVIEPDTLLFDTTLYNRRDASGLEFSDPNSPAPGFCLNELYHYRIPFAEATVPCREDDSLAFTLSAPLAAPGQAVLYTPGFGPRNPFKSAVPITLDPNTGILTFQATEVGLASLTILIERWRWMYVKKNKCFDPNGNCIPGDPLGTDSLPTLDSVRTRISTTTRDTRLQFTDACNRSIPLFRGEIFNQTENAWEFECTETVLRFELGDIAARCNSIEPSGSDFRISQGTVEQPFCPVEIKYVTFPCGADNNTTRINIHLEKPIRPGKYLLFLDKGTDNNTILSQCGVAMPQYHTIPIYVNDNYSYDYVGEDPIRKCTPADHPQPIVDAGINDADFYTWVIHYKEIFTNIPLTDTLDTTLTSRSRIPFNRTDDWSPRRLTGPDTNKYDIQVEIGVNLEGCPEAPPAVCYDTSLMDIEFTKNAPVYVPDFDLCPNEAWPIVNMDTVDNNTGGSFQKWEFQFPNKGFTTIKTLSTDLNLAQAGPGVYVYNVELNNGVCLVSDTFNVSRKPVDVDIYRDTAVCYFETYLLENSVQYKGGADYTYQWFKYDGASNYDSIISMDPSNPSDSSAYRVDNTGWYSLLVTKNGLCTGSDTGFVAVAEDLKKSKPKCVQVTWNGGNIKQVFEWPGMKGADHFEISSDNRVTWDTANGEFFINHTEFGAQKSIWVRAVNGENLPPNSPCKYGPVGFADACEIIVKPINVFTPNGDGINDYLRFDLLELIPGSHLQIYNRWGKLIYEDDNYFNDWDGDDHESGTYYYVLDINDPAYDIMKGTITLIR